MEPRLPGGLLIFMVREILTSLLSRIHAPPHPTYIQVHILYRYTKLLILLDSLFPKTETNGIFFLWRQNNPELNYSPHSFGHILYTDCLLKHVIEEKIGGRNDGKTRKKK
jgi:hypothetical protein